MQSLRIIQIPFSFLKSLDLLFSAFPIQAKLERPFHPSVAPTPTTTVNFQTYWHKFTVINNVYSVYVEFGATSTDTVTVTNTLGSTTSTLKWNILTQQIPCTASYRWSWWWLVMCKKLLYCWFWSYVISFIKIITHLGQPLQLQSCLNDWTWPFPAFCTGCLKKWALPNWTFADWISSCCG